MNLTDLSSTQRKSRIAELMGQTGLQKSLLDTPVRKLSGGEQRRLALLRSLSISPEFLILDEVTAGLDLISTEAVLQLLEKYEQDMTALTWSLLITFKLPRGSARSSMRSNTAKLLNKPFDKYKIKERNEMR